MELLKVILISTVLLVSNFAHSLNLSTSRVVNGGPSFEIASLKEYQVFYFWATWCPDCKEKLSQNLSKYDGKNLSFVTVSTDKDLGKVKDFLVKKPNPYLVLHDEEKILQKQFKIFTVPTVVLTQKQGQDLKVIKSISGKDWSGLDSEIQKLIPQ